MQEATLNLIRHDSRAFVLAAANPPAPIAADTTQ